MARRLTIEEVRAEWKAKGVILLSTTYVNNETPLKFACTRCGKVHEMTWRNYKRHYNPNFLCSECQYSAKPSIETIERVARKRGLHLLSTEYKDAHTPLIFECLKCHKQYNMQYANLYQSKEPFVCRECQRREKEKELQQWLDERDSCLVSDYLSAREPVSFICAKCGEPVSQRVDSLLSSKAPLCEKCRKGILYNPSGKAGTRTNLENYWRELIKRFYNVSSREVYSSHHIRPWSIDAEQRTSITNGFPLLRDLHYHFEGLHTNPDYLNPENWPKEFVLPYQRYDGFKFHNLSSKMIIELFDCSKDLEDVWYLFNKKVYFANLGIEYIPIFVEEIFTFSSQQTLFSIIRSKLSQHFPDIWQYTGVSVNKFSLENLVCKVVPLKEAVNFFTANSLKYLGSTDAVVGLYSENLLVAAMAFRHTEEVEWLLVDAVVLNNTLLEDWEEYLFQYFLDLVKPTAILTYSDIRFNSVVAAECMPAKLGFIYQGLSHPVLRFSSPDNARLYTLEQLQKFRSLGSPLEKGDHIPQYDCGNHRFMWFKNKEEA